jgi:hypothetical protein
MVEFCRAFNMSPSEYKALTLNEYSAFITHLQKEVREHELSSKRRNPR